MGGDSEWEGRNECHGWLRKDLETHFENIQPYPSWKSLHALQTLRLLDLSPQPWTSLWYKPLQTLVWMSGVLKPESPPLEGIDTGGSVGGQGVGGQGVGGRVWEDGVWEDGVWEDGVWEDGVWEDGVWEDGVWEDGVWEDGVWEDGVWEDGVWEDGVWEDGVWEDGVWDDGQVLMASYMVWYCERGCKNDRWGADIGWAGILDICLTPLGRLPAPPACHPFKIFNTKLYYIQKKKVHPVPTITSTLWAWDQWAGIPPRGPPSQKVGPPGCPFSLVLPSIQNLPFFSFLTLK
ncbi:hypothetical protein BS47DRAFT_1368050 [Hydnum rufescens UP504]|uniref:Uncharacterized protein n=1 Tax=Hydnum rufescens UP504 TaxID=1448309 RepID=A0A9P6AHL6_9AGAM|nr:hypothetical protein BS47DRAFT_1368050 [Hydnum rufescens UP504]